MSYMLVWGSMLPILALMFFRFLPCAGAASLLWCHALALACYSCCFMRCLLNNAVGRIGRVNICSRYYCLSFSFFKFFSLFCKTAGLVIALFYLATEQCCKRKVRTSRRFSAFISLREAERKRCWNLSVCSLLLFSSCCIHTGEVGGMFTRSQTRCLHFVIPELVAGSWCSARFALKPVETNTRTMARLAVSQNVTGRTLIERGKKH